MNIDRFMGQQIEVLKEMQDLVVKNGDLLSADDKKELEEHIDKQRRICENMKKVAAMEALKTKHTEAPKQAPAKGKNKVVEPVKAVVEDTEDNGDIDEDFDDLLG